MRSLIITLILFLSMCGLIVMNNLYINQCADCIVSLVEEEFERAPEKAIEKLDSFWQKNHAIVGLSVGYKELDKMSDLILDFKTYFELGIDSEVKRVRILIVETADEISRLEKISIENLL